MADETMKTCNKCGVTKPLSDYGPDRKGKNGLRGACRACTNAATREWRKANPDKHKASEENWRARNPGRYAALNTEWSKRRTTESKKHASRNGAPWSEEDTKTLLRDDISLMEISKLVGRTYGSTAVARHRVRESAARKRILEDVQARIKK